MKRVPIDRLQVDKEIIEFIKNQKDITIDKYSRKGGNVLMGGSALFSQSDYTVAVDNFRRAVRYK